MSAPDDLNSILGYKVRVSPDKPRYVLPAEVIPGVPWPRGFREEINTWAKSFFRDWNAVDDFEVRFNGTEIVVNPRTAKRLQDKFTLVRGLLP